MIRAVFFYVVAVLILSLMLAKTSEAKVRQEAVKGGADNISG